MLTLANDTSVKVVEKNDDYALVLVDTGDGTWLQGYIDASAIKDPAKKAVRNILIILIVSVCVLGTALYFLLRKKKIK